MRTGMLAAIAGLVVLRWLPALPPTGWVLGMLAVGIVLSVGRVYPLGLFLLGLSWSCISTQSALDDRLPAELDGRTLWLEGTVAGLPEVSREVVRFELRDATSRRYVLPRKMRLSWYDGPQLRGGEVWRMAVRLKRPRGLVNPQSFDYEAWLLGQRIGAGGTVKSGYRLREAGGLSSWRDRLRQQLLAASAAGQAGALSALVLGDGSGLSSADWLVFQNTGTVHLMVISGQHIGLMAALLYGLVAGLARLGWWPQRWPWLPVACVVSFAGAMGYGLLAGFQVPVQRACVAVALVLIWRWRYRHLGVIDPLLISLLAVLLWEPLVCLQAGFWLSFGAVILLVLIFSGRLGAWRWWSSLWRVQWTMAVGLVPLLVVQGLPISITSPLANLIAGPIVGFITVPLGLLGMVLLPVPWLGEGLLWLAGGTLNILFSVLALLAQLLPAWTPSALPLWAWGCGLIGGLVLLMPAALPMRSLGLGLLMPLVFLPAVRPESGEADVWVLDVGQGLSVLIRTRDYDLLYDAGPKFGEFDTGQRIVVPSLRALDVRKLDMMLISHADTDHSGGAIAITQGVPVRRVVSGEPVKLGAALKADPCLSDAQWQWNGVRFRLWQWSGARNGNQASCVLMVEAGGEQLWLTGDIDQDAERGLVENTGLQRVHWLLAPHHGSRSSSSQLLLERVRPANSLISRGAHNAFGHPHEAVVQRYRDVGTQIYDTAEQGAIRIKLGRFVPAESGRAQLHFWREK
ncbi:DNA internalization-related competence protein ComEC/Rec2 [Ectopseudomonas mendocina]|uniref:DNA internalization-related competence protein ComEC/Rec2 n=1 Tax=Ectopseudomonas mendocina TaxID=300 RepID=A0ABZ2RKT4_ECTME